MADVTEDAQRPPFQTMQENSLNKSNIMEIGFHIFISQHGDVFYFVSLHTYNKPFSVFAHTD